MGLFGFIGRAAKSLVKTGLGVATHGLSDQVFGAISASKRQKYLSNIEQKQIATVMPVSRMRVTQGYLDDGDLPKDLYARQMQLTGETPGERAARKQNQRLAALAKARAARKAKDLKG